MKFIYMDAPENYQIFFQDPATPIMEGIINFHNDLMYYLIVIGCFVSYLLYKCLDLFYFNKTNRIYKFEHRSDIEIIWTTIPALILMMIAIPSFALLYSIDEVVEPSLTIKVIGHQWYWSYEYGMTGYNDESSETGNFDAYMIPDQDLVKGSLRLLETDRRLVLPTYNHIRFIITSADVIHSWAIPSLGIKSDACPGRLNEITTFITREGVFYGQCSEICGINHAFMPIVVQTTSDLKFNTYVGLNIFYEQGLDKLFTKNKTN